MIRILIMITLLFISIIVMFTKLINYLSNRSELIQLTPVITSINYYYQENHKIPDTINDIADYSVGYMAKNPVYYNKCNEKRYLVTIIINSSKDMTYDSRDRRWHSNNTTCQN